MASSTFRSGSGVAVGRAIKLELVELSFMGNDNPGTGSSSRSATVGLRYGQEVARGQHTEPTRLLACIYHAMMKAARGLGVFTNGDEPTLASYDVASCDRGSESEGTFTVVLEYKGRQHTIVLRSDDLVTGSRLAFLDGLNALLFGSE